jgi:hypothetical protein
LALLHNGLKEATKDLKAIARADLRQTGMIGKWLVQIISKIPPDAEPISRMAHQETFRADVLEKHDQGVNLF